MDYIQGAGMAAESHSVRPRPTGGVMDVTGFLKLHEKLLMVVLVLSTLGYGLSRYFEHVKKAKV